jgi:hypothetical protein
MKKIFNSQQERQRPTDNKQQTTNIKCKTAKCKMKKYI